MHSFVLALTSLLRDVVTDNTINSLISPMGAYFFGFLHGGLFEGGLFERRLKNFSCWFVIFQLRFFNK